MKIVAAKNVPPTQGLAGPSPTQPENKVKDPATDAVGKKTLQDPLRRLRDHVIETSAHATHPTAQGVAEGLKFDKRLGSIAGIVSTIAAAAPQVHAAYAQDGHKWGGHVTNVAAHVGVGAGAGLIGDTIGAEVGEVAGAFVGGAFGGIGALPGAMIGGVIGGTIGGYIGSKMGLDDLNSIQSAVSKRHA